MATIRERSGKLIADFRYMGIRCRETTSLEDNAYNRRILKKRLEQLEAEITLGTFEYEKYFPKSNRVDDFKEKRSQQIAVQTKVPLFKEFTELWLKQKQVEWRTSYQQKVSIIIKNYLIPAFDQSSRNFPVLLQSAFSSSDIGVFLSSGFLACVSLAVIISF